MLRVHAEYGRNYLDYLIPFITNVLRVVKGAISDDEVQSLVRTKFGLNVPIHACNLVLRRLAKKGCLIREHGNFTINRPLPEDDIDARLVEGQRDQVAIVSALLRHSSTRHGVNWSPNDAENALVAYLGRFSLEFMRSFSKGTTLPRIDESEASHFVVSTFLAEMLTSDLSLFERVAKLVKGHMLANALLCNDLESIQKKFGGVTFYLDTPFIMRLLRFWGDAAYRAAEELISLLRQLDGKIAIFEHTIVEVFQVLTFTEDHVNDPKLSDHKMLASLRREGIGSADLAMIRGTFDRFLEGMKVERRQAPHYDEKHQIDETLLENAIRDEIHYSKEKALQHDINSIRSIFALRKSHHPLRIEDAAAVFVTTNGDLAQAAFTYGRHYESASEVTTVITDFSLANIAWLKAPMSAPDLPMMELMAECYAAMDPSPQLWGKFINEADKMKEDGRISPEDHEILRHSPVTRDQLMNLTLGADEALSGGTIQEVLERTKASLTEAKNLEIDEERQRHTATLLREQGLRESQSNLEKRLARGASMTGTTIKWIVFAGVFIIIALALVCAAGYMKPDNGETGWWSRAQPALIVIAVLWAGGDAIWGWSIMGLAQRAGKRAESLILFRLLSVADIDLEKL